MERRERLEVANFRNMSVSKKLEMVRDVNGHIGGFEEFEVYDCWDDLIGNMTNLEVMEKTAKGDVRMNDDYLRFDCDGNLESLDEEKLGEELNDMAGEIVPEIIKLCAGGYRELFRSEYLDELFAE